MKKSARHWELYATHPHFVLGFHGCDASVGEALLQGEVSHLSPSENDWLLRVLCASA